VFYFVHSKLKGLQKHVSSTFPIIRLKVKRQSSNSIIGLKTNKKVKVILQGNGMNHIFVSCIKIIFCLNRFIRTFVTQVKNPYENNTT